MPVRFQSTLQLARGVNGTIRHDIYTDAPDTIRAHLQPLLHMRLSMTSGLLMSNTKEIKLMPACVLLFLLFSRVTTWKIQETCDHLEKNINFGGGG